MDAMLDSAVSYSIFDPTGNLTALVESPVDPACRGELAAALMRLHPSLEQVGFVRFPEDGALRAELDMAGGEFCGNASMSAAALCLLRRGVCDAGERRVRLRVSGTERGIEVRLSRERGDSFAAAVSMPPALAVTETEAVCGALRDTLPLVEMEGISHAIVAPRSPLSALRDDGARAAELIRSMCAALGAPCLGLLFWDGGTERSRLEPLVYVPGSGTLVWEKSCASGCSALGMYLAAQRGGRVRLELVQRGGTLRVESDARSGETWLYGRTKRIG